MSIIRSLSTSIGALSAMLAVATFCTTATGQTGSRPPARTPPPENPRPHDAPRPAGITERQFILRALEMEARKPVTAEENKLALTQIAEDYSRIQLINNKMMSTSIKAVVPNYRSIAAATAEIEKRAGRIKTNLPLPEDDKKEPVIKPVKYKSVSDPAGMKAALLLLDARIMSFVNNPIFKNTSVIEVGEAARAKRDLDTIVDFCNRIGKDSKKLSKSSGQLP